MPKIPTLYFEKKINEYSTWYRSGKDYTNDSKGISKGRESHSNLIVITVTCRLDICRISFLSGLKSWFSGRRKAPTDFCLKIKKKAISLLFVYISARGILIRAQVVNIVVN